MHAPMLARVDNQYIMSKAALVPIFITHVAVAVTKNDRYFCARMPIRSTRKYARIEYRFDNVVNIWFAST